MTPKGGNVGSGATGSLPDRSAAIKWLQALLLVSVVVSLGAFALAAWLDYANILGDARRNAQQTAFMVRGHALAVFQANEVLMDRVQELLGHQEDALLRAHERELHLQLKSLTSAVPQAEAVMVWDRDGQPLLSNIYYPVPHDVTIAQRPYFLAQKNAKLAHFVTAPLQGVIGKQVVISFSQRRENGDGTFEGLVSVSLSPRYLTDFYREVFAEDPSRLVALFHQDGNLIAHYPTEATPPRTLPTDSPVMKAMAEGIASGVSMVVSPDGNSRLVAFSKVDPYPVFVHITMDYSFLMRQWHEDLLVDAAFVLPAMLCLLLITWIALQRTRREHAAVLHWREEVARRAAIADELRQAHKLEAVGQLTSGIAHDFNNLLHIVRMNTSLLDMKLSGASELRIPLASIRKALDTGQRLTQHLLGFSRRQELQPLSMDLAQALPSICELLKQSLPPNIKLRTEIAPGTWPVEVDRAELELALLNMTINARDAMPDGGTITLGMRNVLKDDTELVDAGLPNVDFVAVSVADTGPGIPPEIIDRIFDPFFTTKESGKGTGLGLSRIYGFAQQSRGKARALSPAGGGAKVILYFPRLVQASAPAAATEVR